MKIFGSIQELVSLVYRKGSSEITLRPNSGTTYAANRVMDLPPGDSAHVLVSEAATQTLTNKSVSGDSNTLSNIGIASLKTVLADANKAVLRDASGAVISASITNTNIDAAAAIALTKLASVAEINRALQSDGSGKIVSSSITSTELGHLSGVTSNIQTQLGLKEPTITILPISKGGTNSSTSLNNNRVMVSSGSAIVEAAAITASRALASDANGIPVASSVTSTELGYLSGVTSAVQTQISAKADTSALTAHTGASSGVHGVTGSVVGTSDTQALTNKDMDGGTASNTSRYTLPKANKSVLDGLTRKQATLVYGSDTNKVYADDGSTLKEIGSGSSGINYLSAQYGADALGTVELSVGNTLASSTRSSPTQWGNSAASALITQSTDSTLRGTTNYLVAYTANAQFVESPLFSIDGEDLGKPLLVQFDVSGVGTADDVQVYIARYNSSNVLQERILVAGTASATTPNSAQVPTGVTTFKGFFIPSSTATDKYAVRWLRNANNTSMRLDTFFVGPQSLAQGAVVTGWQAYTPTLTNFGSKGTTRNEAYWRRIGSDIEIKFSYTGDTTAAGTGASPLLMSLPSGLTFDSSKSPTPGSFTDDDYFGTYREYAIATALTYSSVQQVYPNSSTTFRFVKQGTGGSLATVDLNVARSVYITGEIRAPIAEWSSGTTTLADRAVEEYAYNTDTTNASNTSSFANGPDGALFPAITVTGTTVNKRVRFSTAIQSTDALIVEYQQQSSGPWRNAAQRFPLTAQGANNVYGIDIINVSTTDIDIRFGSLGAVATGATYGSAGEVWNAYKIDNWKWRVRKVSGGAAVGFPVSARNIVGDTSGTAVPAGYISELKGTLRNGTGGFTYSTRSTTVTTTSAASLISLSLDQGSYLITIKVLAGASVSTYFYGSVYCGGTNLMSSPDAISVPTSSTAYGSIVITIPVVISSNSTTVDFRGAIGSGTSLGNSHEMYCVRIG